MAYPKDGVTRHSRLPNRIRTTRTSGSAAFDGRLSDFGALCCARATLAFWRAANQKISRNSREMEMISLRATARTVVLAIALGSLAVGIPAGAKSKINGDKLLDELEACKITAEPAARLACYDERVEELKIARKDNKNFLGREARAPFEPINSTAVSVAELQPGTWLLVLADHSVWRTNDDVRFIPRAGDGVKVVKAAMGSFMANIGKESAVRVQPMR
jgi:hypothetical protein